MADDNLDKELYKNLRVEIRQRWLDKWIEAKWKDRTFSDFTNEVDIAKIAVMKAVVHTATDHELVVPEETLVTLQDTVKLASSPKSIEPSMRDAINDSDQMVDHLSEL